MIEEYVFAVCLKVICKKKSNYGFIYLVSYTVLGIDTVCVGPHKGGLTCDLQKVMKRTDPCRDLRWEN